MSDGEETGGTSPCFASELVGGHVVDRATWRDVTRFRKAERVRLYELRRAQPQTERALQSARVIDGLHARLPELRGRTIAGYWPIRGELDLRPWMKACHEAGACIILPVVVQKGEPVEFHRWTPGCKMTRGVWNIPVPKATEQIVPDTVIVPLLGIDRACFRLGNGGGYYDMTLAALTERPNIIAVGQDFCCIETIFPQPWDIPMDSAILGDGTVMEQNASG